MGYKFRINWLAWGRVFFGGEGIFLYFLDGLNNVKLKGFLLRLGFHFSFTPFYWHDLNICACEWLVSDTSKRPSTLT